MERPKFYMPQIEKDQIGAESRLSDKDKELRMEKREHEDDISKYILRWWKGDAHTHSKESTREGYSYPEGIYDIQEIMDYYKSIDLEFVCFTEHSSKPGSPQRQSVEGDISQSLVRESERIAMINRERGGDIAALSGVETNIMLNEKGESMLDMPDEILEKLDLVVASRHAIGREKEPSAIKETLLMAIRNKNVDVIGHPDRYTRKDNEKSQEYWQEYWSIWPEILQEMQKEGKAFEINLNNQPSKKLIDMLAKTDVKLFINYDAHDFNQFKKETNEITKAGENAKSKWAKEEVSEDDIEVLKNYKMERLSSGPGVNAILKLVRWIKKLESLGVEPERVVNSSLNNLLSFLAEDRNKDTKNLAFLKSKILAE